MSLIRRHLGSPPMIVACVSLVVALGGVSYAAAVLPSNSVGTAQLKQKAVTRAKLKRNAVTSAKVKDGSLLAADFKAGQLPAGATGPAGPQGPKGHTGATGSPGLSGFEIVEKTESTASMTHTTNAWCPTGKRAIAVSGHATAPSGKVAITGNDVTNADLNGKSYALGSVSAQWLDGQISGTWSVTAKVTCAYVR